MMDGAAVIQRTVIVLLLATISIYGLMLVNRAEDRNELLERIAVALEEK